MASSAQQTGDASGFRDSSFNPRLGLAALFSTLIPGAGHLFIRRWKKGIALLGLVSILLVLYWLVRIPINMAALLLAVLGTIVLCVYSGWDAGYSSRIPQQRLSRLWLVLILPAAMFGAAIFSNIGLLVSGVRPYFDPSTSMETTIAQGSRMMVDLRYYQTHKPERGEIIVFQTPNEPGLYIVKRIIAVGGQTVDIERDKVAVDDDPLDEPYILIDQRYPDPKPHFHLKVPAGKLFVMGDNRHISLDSRFDYFGLPDVSGIRGRVIYVMPGLRSNRKWMETGSN